MNYQTCRKLNNLKKIRERLNVTQAELGRILKVSPQYISALERGLNELTYYDAFLIARYLGMTPDSLFLNDAHERVHKEEQFYKELNEEKQREKRVEFEKEFERFSK